MLGRDLNPNSLTIGLSFISELNSFMDSFVNAWVAHSEELPPPQTEIHSHFSVALGAAGVLKTPGSSNNYRVNQSLFCTLLL